MTNDSATGLTVGVDLGDRFSVICVLDKGGEVIEQSRIATTESAFRRKFEHDDRMRVALEVGTHSAWVSDLIAECGHEVLVANARDLARITKSDRKNDRNDAELLARLARMDPKLLSPIKHREKTLRGDLAVIRARDALVRTRTLLVNNVRGLVKAAGARLPKCSTASFHRNAVEHVPDELRPAVEGSLRVLATLTEEIKAYDKRIEELANTKYEATRVLRQVDGVGALTALAFVLTLGDPQRFKKSRDVGPYLGLCPKQQQSSGSNPQLRISKAGDGLVRRLLVGSAQYILGPFGPDCDLRRWGLELAARGGKNGKKRAVVAVARKTAVLLHRLWVTNETYRPLNKPSTDTTSNAVTKTSVDPTTAEASKSGARRRLPKVTRALQEAVANQ